MRVMVIVKASADSEAGKMPDQELLAEMSRFNEQLTKAGVMVSADGLHPSSAGKRMRFSGNKRIIIDGPFTETKELIAGYWIWEVASLDDALEWARRCPNLDPGIETEIEIRPMFDVGECGKAAAPERDAQAAAQ
jgi:hypothetical protein